MRIQGYDEAPVRLAWLPSRPSVFHFRDRSSNFAVSALLKGWIDQVVRVGRTVRFNPNGPQGLLTGKKAVVITSRGGSHRAGTPTAQYDCQEPYLRHILAFVGLTDATFIHAENQKTGELGEPSRAAAIAQIQEAALEQTAAAALQ